MDKNVGGSDRAVRWIAGSALVAYGLKSEGWKRWLSLLAGSSVLSSAGTQKCWFNKMVGRDTLQHEVGRQKADALVDETSQESFPASDAPSWAGSR